MLPVSEQWNQDSLDGAQTGVVAGGSLDSSGGKTKQQKKKRSISFSSDPASSRLEVIAETPDDTMENVSLESGVEVVHADDEEEDDENYVFDYAQTTPDTSFSSYQSSAASPEKANNAKSAPEAREQAGNGSGLVAALAGGTALAVVSSRSYSASDSDSDPAADEARKGGILSATRNNDSSSLKEDEVEVLTVTSNESSAYYMLDTTTGGAGSIIKVGSSQDEGLNDKGSIENESQPSSDNSPKSSSHLASSGGDSQGASAAIVPVNRGARSSYAMDNRTPRSHRTKSLLDTEEGHGMIVPVARDNNRSSYAMEPPSLSRDRPNFDANAADGAMVPVDRKEGQYASGVALKEHGLLLQKLRSIKSESTMSLAAIDEDATSLKGSTNASVNHAPASSYYFQEQLSPCASMYLEEDSTVATFESAPLDERTSRAQMTRVQQNPSPARADAFSSSSPVSTLSPTPKRTNAVSQTNQASVSLDAISPLTVERGDAHPIPKQSPLYVMQAPLSPGSTVGSTSLYVDDDGSVEMERDDNSDAGIPLDEKKSIPASVKLDACVSPQQKTVETVAEPAKETSKMTVRKSYISPTTGQSPSARSNSLPRKTRHNSITSGAPKLTQPPPLSPTSTSTSNSRSSAESASNYLRPLMDPGKSVRSLRKTRLEHTVRSWKVDELKPATKPEPVLTRRMEQAPLTQTRPTILPKRSPPRNDALTSAIDGQSHTTGDKTVAPGSPRSFASPGIDSMDVAVPSSSESDRSSEESPAPPVRRGSRRETSHRSQRSQMKRSSSNGRRTSRWEERRSATAFDATKN